MPNLDFEAAVGLIVLAVLIVIVLLNEMRRSRRSGRTGRGKSQWALLALFVVVAVLFLSDPAGWQQWLANPSAQLAVLGPIALLVVGTGAVLIWQAWKNRIVRRVTRLAAAGDTAGAAALVRQQLERHRKDAGAWNLLASLLLVEGRWEEGLNAVAEAERLGGPAADVLGNKGFALWKTGKPNDGRACLEEAVRRQPDNFVLASNLAFLLLDLGRAEEARAQVARAEQLFAQQEAFYRSDRSVRQETLTTLREKLAAMPAGA